MTAPRGLWTHAPVRGASGSPGTFEICSDWSQTRRRGRGWLPELQLVLATTTDHLLALGPGSGWGIAVFSGPLHCGWIERTERMEQYAPSPGWRVFRESDRAWESSDACWVNAPKHFLRPAKHSLASPVHAWKPVESPLGIRTVTDQIIPPEHIPQHEPRSGHH